MGRRLPGADRIVRLVLIYVGQVQTDPTLIGYIEGAILDARKLVQSLELQ